MLRRRRALRRVHSLGKLAALELQSRQASCGMLMAQPPVRRTQSNDSYLARSTGERMVA